MDKYELRKLLFILTLFTVIHGRILWIYSIANCIVYANIYRTEPANLDNTHPPKTSISLEQLGITDTLSTHSAGVNNKAHCPLDDT